MSYTEHPKFKPEWENYERGSCAGTCAEGSGSWCLGNSDSSVSIKAFVCFWSRALLYAELQGTGWDGAFHCEE